MEAATLYNRGKKYGTVELTEKEAEKHPTTVLMLAELILMPTYIGRNNVRILNGCIPPEIQEIWLVAAITADTQENTKLLFVGRTQQVNW